MPSTRYTRVTQAVSPREYPIMAIEILHALLADPVRLVKDNADLEISGKRYVAADFRISFPSDQERQLPRATFEVDNIGRRLTRWLEASQGGRDSRVRLLQVLRSQPDVIERELWLDLKNVRLNDLTVSAQLGYEDMLNRQGMPYTYRPENAPSLF